jgi:peptide/nickel transport system substrate-binding protein
MQKNGPLAYLLLAGISLVLVLLGLFIFQLDTIEERFIRQGQQLRSLGESSDRLSSRIDRLIGRIEGGGIEARPSRSGTSSSPGTANAGASSPYPNVTLLHPDAENLLQPDEIFWPSASASLDGTLTRGWPSGDPKGFNPVTENAGDVSSSIAHYVSATLARRMTWVDPDQWVGDLAWRVEVTDDNREFTFYIKPGVQWHTPSGIDLDDSSFEWLRERHELTAHDFVFAYKMITHPQVENGFAKSYFQDLESYEAIDDHTLVVRWKRKLYGNLGISLGMEPLPEFLWAYDRGGNRFPEETLGLRFNQHWYNNKGMVGVGPYRFALYEPGSQMRLVRNEDYYGVKPAIREIVYPIYTDPNKTLIKLKARELSFASLRPGQYREEVLKWLDEPEKKRPKDNPFVNGDLVCENKLNFVYYYLGWNGNKPLFADKRVRRAMTMALNRQGIIDNVYVGLGTVSSSPYLADNPGNDPDVVPYSFDLAGAAALLAEAGWEDSNGDGLLDKDLDPDDGDDTRSNFTFKFLIYGNSPEYSSMANIYKEDLLKIGVKMGVDKADWSLMQKKMDEKNFDAFTGGWGLSWETDPYQLWHSSQADIPRGSNRVGFRNAEADVLIENLRKTFDPAERARLLQRFHQILHDEQPYTFFRYRVDPFCWWKEVEDVKFPMTRPLVNTIPWSVRTNL